MSRTFTAIKGTQTIGTFRSRKKALEALQATNTILFSPWSAEPTYPIIWSDNNNEITLIEDIVKAVN